MSTGIEIFGAVAAAVALAGNIVKAFGTRRNAPRQVERLQRMLEELQDEELIAAAVAIAATKPKEQATILRLMNTCTDLLERHAPKDQAGRVGRQIWMFLWPATVEEDLRAQNDEISHELNRLYARLNRSSG